MPKKKIMLKVEVSEDGETVYVNDVPWDDPDNIPQDASLVLLYKPQHDEHDPSKYMDDASQVSAIMGDKEDWGYTLGQLLSNSREIREFVDISRRAYDKAREMGAVKPITSYKIERRRTMDDPKWAGECSECNGSGIKDFGDGPGGDTPCPHCSNGGIMLAVHVPNVASAVKQYRPLTVGEVEFLAGKHDLAFNELVVKVRTGIYGVPIIFKGDLVEVMPYA